MNRNGEKDKKNFVEICADNIGRIGWSKRDVYYSCVCEMISMIMLKKYAVVPT